MDRPNGVATGERLGVEILNALGLDTDLVRAVTIVCEPGKPTGVVIERTMRNYESAEIMDSLSEYELHARPTPQPIPPGDFSQEFSEEGQYFPCCTHCTHFPNGKCRYLWTMREEGHRTSCPCQRSL